MSKFLKFIVHLVILLAILDVLALAVPPFLGINTAIVDGTEQTNLPMGSVTYAKPVGIGELQVGDSILEQEGSSVYRYRINSIDSSTGVYQVYDQTDVDSGEKAITLRNTAPKVMITIGYIGYLIIATQSREGLMVISLSILFLIILFILAELWRKDKKVYPLGELEEDEEDEGAKVAIAEQPMSKRQLKKEMKQRIKEDALMDKARAKEELKEATRQLKEENKARKKELKQLKKEAKKRARTGGFVEDYDPIEATLEKPRSSTQHEDVAADEANQILGRESVAAALVQEDTENVEILEDDAHEAVATQEAVAEVSSEEPSTMKAEVSEETPLEVREEEVLIEKEPEPVEYKKMAIPIYTEEELLAQAQAAGDTPQLIHDEIYGVTLLDYSDIIIEEK